MVDRLGWRKFGVTVLVNFLSWGAMRWYAGFKLSKDVFPPAWSMDWHQMIYLIVMALLLIDFVVIGVVSSQTWLTWRRLAVFILAPNIAFWIAIVLIAHRLYPLFTQAFLVIVIFAMPVGILVWAQKSR